MMIVVVKRIRTAVMKLAQYLIIPTLNWNTAVTRENTQEHRKNILWSKTVRCNIGGRLGELYLIQEEFTWDECNDSNDDVVFRQCE